MQDQEGDQEEFVGSSWFSKCRCSGPCLVEKTVAQSLYVKINEIGMYLCASGKA